MVFIISIQILIGPFPFKGLFGGIYHFHSNYTRTSCKQRVETLIRRRVLAVSDLGLHCLPMSYKKDARLIWLN